MILHENWKNHELIREISRTMSCSISESPQHFISVLAISMIVGIFESAEMDVIGSFIGFSIALQFAGTDFCRALHGAL